WRRSLACSPAELATILDTARDCLSVTEILQSVLPDDPALLYAAGQQLSQAGAAEHDVDLIFAQALRLVESCRQDDAVRFALQARLQARLRQLPEARQSYELALVRRPQDASLRLELGQLLIRAGHLADARSELSTLLNLQPDHEQAKVLFDSLFREPAERGP